LKQRETNDCFAQVTWKAHVLLYAIDNLKIYLYYILKRVL